MCPHISQGQWTNKSLSTSKPTFYTSDKIIPLKSPKWHVKSGFIFLVYAQPANRTCQTHCVSSSFTQSDRHSRKIFESLLFIAYSSCTEHVNLALFSANSSKILHLNFSSTICWWKIQNSIIFFLICFILANRKFFYTCILKEIVHYKLDAAGTLRGKKKGGLIRHLRREIFQE